MSGSQTTSVIFSTDTVIYEPGKIVSTIRQCGFEVRWNGVVLEQAWIVRGIGTTGAVESMETEWLPVPQKDMEK